MTDQSEQREAFEQFVEEFDKAVEPADELEPEAEVTPAEAPAAEPSPPIAEETAPEPEPIAAEPQPVAPAPDLGSELAKLREELALLRTQPAQPAAPQPEPYEAVREKAFGELEKVYRPREEDLENFLTDPGPALAKMASRLHVSIIENVAQLVQQHMAQMPQFLEAREQRTRAEQGFWGKFDERWPELARGDPKYREKVAAFGQSYRQFNPQATEKDFIEKVGAQVSVMLGIVPTAPTVPAGTPKAAPTKPPAKGGKPGPAQGKPASPWEELSRDFEADDSW